MTGKGNYIERSPWKNRSTFIWNVG